MDSNAYVVRFDDLAAHDYALVGGKAASLGRLVSVGFPVPAGSTISTAGYSEFMAVLQDQVTAILAHADYSHATRLEEQAQAIRSLICNTPMPPDLGNAICAAHRDVGENAAPRVAVRSSGTAEDLAEASFAGLHDTFLDVEGEAAGLDAVRYCWASLWNARAIRG